MASSDSKPIRKRAKNFESSENLLLLDLLCEYNDILKSKHNNIVTQAKKKAVLQLITDKVNALGVCHRSVQQVKNKWANIVVDGKEKNAQMKKSAEKTGGGPPCSPPTVIQERVINLMAEKPGFSGLEGNLESDCFSEEEEGQKTSDDWVQIEIPGPLEELIPPVPNEKGDAQQTRIHDIEATHAIEAEDGSTTMPNEEGNIHQPTGSNSKFKSRQSLSLTNQQESSESAMPSAAKSAIPPKEKRQERSESARPLVAQSTLPSRGKCQAATKLPTVVRKRPMSNQELQRDVLVLQRSNMHIQRDTLQIQYKNALLENEMLELKLKKMKAELGMP